MKLYLKIASLGLMLMPFMASAQAPANTLNYLKSQPMDAWAVMALASNGQPTDLTALRNFQGGSATDYARQILALLAAGEYPSSWDNRDLVRQLLDRHYKDGQIGDVNLLNDDFWGILALSGALRTGYQDAGLNRAIQDSKNYILANQKVSYGWGFSKNGETDSNDTAAAIMALLEAGVPASDHAIQKAFEYLKTLQHENGGMVFSPGLATDASSDAWTILLLNKMGIDPRTYKKANLSIVDHIYSLGNPDGSFSWHNAEPGDPGVTRYVALALSGRALPVMGAALSSSPASQSNPAANPSQPTTVPPLGTNTGTLQPTPLYSPMTPPSGSLPFTVPGPVIAPPFLPSRAIPSNAQIIEERTFTIINEKNYTDTDKDGLNYGQEIIHGTNPDKPDSDGDGHKDGREVSTGYDPLNPAPCKKIVDPGYDFVYGQKRLKSPSLEKCFAKYLSAKLGKMKNKKPWDQSVNAFIYGGYSVNDIKQWLNGKNTVHVSQPKWLAKLK